MSHIFSRGSLSSIKYGKDYEEDPEWEKQVLLSSVSLFDSVNYMDEDIDEEIINLWGKYNGSCPHITVGFLNKGCFRR